MVAARDARRRRGRAMGVGRRECRDALSAVDADVVVCSWAGDDRELTLACLRRAAAQAAPGRVHVVNMSPATDLVERAGTIAGVVVHHVPQSSGLGESRQIGLARAPGRYVAFLDSD